MSELTQTEQLENKTSETRMKAQKRYDAKEEVKQRKRKQYLKKVRKTIPNKINKLLEDFNNYTEEDKQYLYNNCNFIITNKTV